MASYHLKRISFHGQEVPIVVQNENGPCPLLAIANTLLLRGLLTLPANSPNISLERLMQMVAEYLLDSNKVEDESPLAANMQKNLDDVISALPKLATGVDVNPSFDHFRGFEFTDEVAIFDMFNISLVHGWLVDPMDEYRDFGEFTYNQLVGKLVSILGSETPARLMSTHNSFALTSKRESAHTPLKSTITEEPPLIQLESTEVMNTNVLPVVGQLTLDDEAGPSRVLESANIATSLDISGLHQYPDVVEREHNEVDVKEAGEVGVASPETMTDGDKPPAEDLQDQKKSLIKSGVPSSSYEAGQEGTEEKENDEFGERAQRWLDQTSNQLTPYGLLSLQEGMQDEQLAVFFRNNHFNTIYKRDSGLYLLVTDMGYLTEPGVAWEKLDDVDGDTQMVTDEFVPFARSDHVESSEQDVELHKALAASLATVPGTDAPGRREGIDGPDASLPDGFLMEQQDPPPAAVENNDADYALALQLQEEEIERRDAALQEASENAARDAEWMQVQAGQGNVEPDNWNRVHQLPSRHGYPQQASQRCNNQEGAAQERQTGFLKYLQSFKQFFTSKK